MLRLTRKRGQSIVITDKITGKAITIHISSIDVVTKPDGKQGRGVSLALDADEQFSIMRNELLDKEVNDE